MFTSRGSAIAILLNLQTIEYAVDEFKWSLKKLKHMHQTNISVYRSTKFHNKGHISSLNKIFYGSRIGWSVMLSLLSRKGIQV
jgi:hypothetical protein